MSNADLILQISFFTISKWQWSFKSIHFVNFFSSNFCKVKIAHLIYPIYVMLAVWYSVKHDDQNKTQKPRCSDFRVHLKFKSQCIITHFHVSNGINRLGGFHYGLCLMYCPTNYGLAAGACIGIAAADIISISRCSASLPTIRPFHTEKFLSYLLNPELSHLFAIHLWLVWWFLVHLWFPKLPK